MVGIGGIATLYQSNVVGFTLAMSCAGFGWGMATIGATAALHRAGRPSATALALHDVSLFSRRCSALPFSAASLKP